MPVYLDKRDVAAEWVRRGGTREGFAEEDCQTVDLRMLVHRMETEPCALTLP